MSALLKAAALALAIGLAAGPARAIDPFFPGFGNNGIDVLHYGLALDVEPVNNRLDGKALLTIRAHKRLSTFSLDLHGLQVSHVVVNGHSASFQHEDDKLRITPRRAIDEGRLFTVYIAYAGEPDPIEDPTAPGAGLDLGWFHYQGSTYALSEPVGASSFYPANDEPTDKARFTFVITAPEGYTAVANGVPVASWSYGDERRFVWRMSDPMTTWLATVHVNRFELSKTRARDETPVRVYATEATPEEDVQGYLLAAQMLTWMERYVGPYPFDSYGSVVVDDPALYYALETQAMSTFPLGAADPAIVAHELAHQWFGNSVSVARWEDLWLAEGAATYFEVLWPNRNNPAGFHAEMRAIYDYVAENEIGPAVVDAPDQLFSDRTYYRGAAALYALQLQVGAPDFFRILRRFAQENRGGNVTSAKFIRTAVQVSGDPAARDLLEAWLYEEPVPPLPGQPVAAARRSPAERPDIVGMRCGRGAHRGAAACRE